MKKIRPVLLILFVGCLTFVMAACSQGGSEEQKNGSLQTSNDVQYDEEDYKEIVQGNNTLGLALLNEVEEDEDGNIFTSPTSLFMALSMVSNGADGETKKELEQLLKVENIDRDLLNKANASLISKLQKNKEDLKLSIGNSIWLNDEMQFREEFVKRSEDYFGAEVREVDVQDHASIDRVNDWVSEATNGKIKEIVEAPLKENLVSLLVNAIYFKGDWAYPFDPEQTTTESFYLADGAEKDVPLMTLQEELEYMENTEFQAVKLPYGEKDMHMTVFLPAETSDLDTFKKSLTAENWQKWDEQFSLQEGTVMLPKFRLEYETLLNNPLKNLDLKLAFDRENADFSEMITEDRPVWISEVKQKTFLEVNEEGAEAAGATSVEMETTSAPIDPPFQFKVNRPFFLTISDSKTNTILFTGVISNPKEE